jgi:hypothetical protein
MWPEHDFADATFKERAFPSSQKKKKGYLLLIVVAHLSYRL